MDDRISSEAGPRSLAVRLGGLVALACLFAVLVSLGVWQLQRLAWKRDLIARVEARVHADPMAAPGPAQWPALDTTAEEYARVTVEGRFSNDKETLVQAVTERGPGFWVLTPMRTAAGWTVLVNRGFVPPDRKTPTTRLEGEPETDTNVTGLLRPTEPGGAFLHSNDPADGRWYSRDVAAIAAAQALGPVAPYFIDADAAPNPGGWPVGGLTVIAFPNNHLQYALTWFAMGGLLAGFAVWLWRDRRRRAAAGR